jgi:transposase InsO family protein
MRSNGLVGVNPRRKWRRGRPDTAPAPDLLQRDFRADRPNQRWVADIERHEVLFNRAVVKGHRHVLVAAGALKLRAA